MRKKLILFLTILTAMSMAMSCNKSSDDPYEYVSSTSVAVTNFYLSENKKVLDSLQNVFFSIDLDEFKIFNADSLPYGTKVNRLIPNITVVSSASLVELTYKLASGADSTVNYATNSTDSIDFSNGPVMLRVVSESATVDRTYEIKVNVHKVKPDTLAWKQIESASLPTSFATIDAQRTAVVAGRYYCLTSSAGSYSLAVTDNPADPAWSVQEIQLPFAADVSTLRSSADAFYMLDEAGALYASADFSAWTSTGKTWHYIYGAYADQILGCAESNGVWTLESYPSGATAQLPEGFPVEGTSLPSVYDLPMAYAPQLVMVGGVDCTGAYSNDAWGYDGESLICVTKQGKSLPEGLKGMSVVAYDLFQVSSTNWKPVAYPALVAFGGINASGEINRTVYYSRDWGLTWAKAPKLMQLPAEVPVAYDATALVHSTLMSLSRSVEGWRQIAVAALPPHCQWELPAASRAVAPVDSWECPAIYVFGGRDQNGNTINQLWRAIILRYTFQPKY